MKQRFLLIIFFLAISFWSYGQKNPEVDFKHLEAEVQILPLQKRVTGNVVFTFDILKETDSIFIDAQAMDISKVYLNNKGADFYNEGKRLWIISDFKRSESNHLRFSYSTTPKQTMYFVGWDNPADSPYKPQVWTQGQGRYTSHWLPSFDDATEKIEVDLDYILPKGLEVMANGKLLKRIPVNDSLVRWEYDMENQMSSYLIAIAAGNYYKKEITSSSNVPISLYFYPGDEAKVEPTYRHTKRIYDFLEQETGFPYPWQNYKQAPVRDFLYSGMENTGATIFSDIYMTDSIGFFDRNYVMVNAHELAHQWFGNTVTAISGEHHWLQEGFATYYALLAERELYGDDYYYWKLFLTAEQLKESSDKGKGEAIMNPKAGSVTFYQKGAWALHILRERIGDEAFREGVKNYLQKYKFQSVTIQQFLQELEKTSGKDLSGFMNDWLRQTAFQATEALASLQKSDFIKEYLAIAALREIPLQEKRELLSHALDFPINEHIGREVISQLTLEDPVEAVEIYKKAFDSNDLSVRQAIAFSLEEVPQELKSDFESLLEDESYLTKEAALYTLWMNFPQDRIRYLEKLKGVEGLSDKNVRILWLALNLATPEYEEKQQVQVYRELSGYTAPEFPFLIRQNSFQYLSQLNSFSDSNFIDLMQATQHQVNRFKSFSRNLLQELVKNENYRKRFQSIKQELPSDQQEYLEQVLKN